MRAVFFGTPAWAIPSLEALISLGTEIPLVVTNPDRPAGRGMRSTSPPVKNAAEAAGIEVVQPMKASDPDLAERLRASGVEVAVVVAYGKILPGALLEIPARGFVNVHFSLLPAYRGAAPVQRALMDGASETGVTLIRLTEGMDEGPIIAAGTEKIDPDDSAASLGARLATIGAELLGREIGRYMTGAITPVEQDHERATYAPKITSDEARIDWARSSSELRNFVRGLNPDPGAWTTHRGARWKVLGVGTVSDSNVSPGELAFADDELVAGTGDGAVALVEVQPAGKKPMSGADLARGLRLAGGEKLE